MSERNQVFISYSHADAKWLKRLQVHLAPLERDSLVSRWDDTMIKPGQRWRDEIKKAIDGAKAAVLMVSADFLASEFIARHELPPLLAAAEYDGALILPVILSPCAFQETESLSQFQAINPLTKPLAALSKAKQEGFLDAVARAIRAALSPPPGSAAPAVAGSGALYNVPPRNSLFEGRQELLVALSEKLAADHRVAFSGLGGIGKTEAIVEYAYRHRQQYRCTFWVSAGTRESLAAGFTKIAEFLDLPQKASREQNDAIAAALLWLNSHQGWLLILDGADDLSQLRSFLPAEDRGHVLITTRASAIGKVATRLELEPLPVAESVEYLLRRARVIERKQIPADAPAEEQSAAERIAAELGGIPLALDQASAFVEETACGMVGYLGLWHKRSAQLLDERGFEFSGHADPVTVTWNLSFERVRHDSPLAAQLLSMAAFLHPDAIPAEIVGLGYQGFGSAPEQALAEPLELNRAIREAGRYSLLRRDSERNTLAMHQLVQKVLRDSLPEAQQRDWVVRAIAAVASAFPIVSYASWERCERLITHAETLGKFAEQFEIADMLVGKLLSLQAEYYLQRGRFAEAEAPLTRAVRMLDALSEMGCAQLAVAAQLLGRLYMEQGRFSESEQLLRRALAIRERLLGADHTDVASTLVTLAEVCRLSARYDEAEQACGRALKIRERAFGEHHPDVATVVNALGTIQFGRANWTEAEVLFRRALEIRVLVHTPNHPRIAQVLNNIAVACRKQGRNVEAEEMYLRALRIREEALGSTHPDVAETLNNLGFLYFGQDRYDEAERLYSRAL